MLMKFSKIPIKVGLILGYYPMMYLMIKNFDLNNFLILIMLLLCLLTYVVRCHVVIPPVDINIKVLGSFVGFDIANDADRYLAY